MYCTGKFCAQVKKRIHAPTNGYAPQGTVQLRLRQPLRRQFMRPAVTHEPEWKVAMEEGRFAEAVDRFAEEAVELLNHVDRELDQKTRTVCQNFYDESLERIALERLGRDTVGQNYY